jgi:hypothetical protein
MRYATLIALLAAGCSTDSPTGLTVVSAELQQGISLGGCGSDPDEVLQWADLAIVLLVHETARQGYAARSDIVDAYRSKPVRVCLADVPGPCCRRGGPCVGPCVKIQGGWTCPPMAGCTDGTDLWVARIWDGHPGYVWQLTLVHELGNVLRLRLLTNERYTPNAATPFYASGGPIDVAQRAILEAVNADS